MQRSAILILIFFVVHLWMCLAQTVQWSPSIITDSIKLPAPNSARYYSSLLPTADSESHYSFAYDCKLFVYKAFVFNVILGNGISVASLEATKLTTNVTIEIDLSRFEAGIQLCHIVAHTSQASAELTIKLAVTVDESLFAFVSQALILQRISFNSVNPGTEVCSCRRTKNFCSSSGT